MPKPLDDQGELRQEIDKIRRSFLPSHQELDALVQLFNKELAQIEKAYGGCHNCYGKGYATVNDAWHGYDTDQDIGSPGGYVSGGDRNAMKFCSCDRGEQLRAQLARREAEARIDECEMAISISGTSLIGKELVKTHSWEGGDSTKIPMEAIKMRKQSLEAKLAALNQHTPKEG